MGGNDDQVALMCTCLPAAMHALELFCASGSIS
jgi:hypothetical protein